MPRLDASELEQLIKHVKDAISSTPFACSSLEPLSGGTTSFVFRGVLAHPFQEGDVPDQQILKTVIVKHAAGFASCNSDFAIDDSRAVGEPQQSRRLLNFHRPMKK